MSTGPSGTCGKLYRLHWQFLLQGTPFAEHSANHPELQPPVLTKGSGSIAGRFASLSYIYVLSFKSHMFAVNGQEVLASSAVQMHDQPTSLAKNCEWRMVAFVCTAGWLQAGGSLLDAHQGNQGAGQAAARVDPPGQRNAGLMPYGIGAY